MTTTHSYPLPFDQYTASSSHSLNELVAYPDANGLNGDDAEKSCDDLEYPRIALNSWLAPVCNTLVPISHTHSEMVLEDSKTVDPINLESSAIGIPEVQTPSDIESNSTPYSDDDSLILEEDGACRQPRTLSRRLQSQTRLPGRSDDRKSILEGGITPNAYGTRSRTSVHGPQPIAGPPQSIRLFQMHGMVASDMKQAVTVKGFRADKFYNFKCPADQCAYTYSRISDFKRHLSGHLREAYPELFTIACKGITIEEYSRLSEEEKGFIRRSRSHSHVTFQRHNGEWRIGGCQKTVLQGFILTFDAHSWVNRRSKKLLKYHTL
ncbi:hypothetical protein DFP72DRAFT_851147 [Ephemerocybe angulata]|uniref:C2H2-type domain-containing protein n=1 Tax=Ephemerocybe angulata TaxID=980116 RepID=A0A8H6HSY2_9AGAR|nr:hypothetical protein DFP72DRAFT_851147 [Tulosesus angulatus]